MTTELSVSHNRATLSRWIGKIQVGCKPARTTRNRWIDSSLLLIATATLTTAYLSKWGHIRIGLLLTVLLGIHLADHWQWLVAVIGRVGKAKHNIQVKLAIDLLLLTTFLATLFSGLIVTLIYAPAVSRFHTVVTYAWIATALSHLLLNGKWILHQVRQMRS